MSNIKTQSESVSIPKEIAVSALSGAIRKVYFSIKGKALQVTEIKKLTGLSAKTIRKNLRTLKKNNLAKDVLDLNDLRKRLYKAC